MKSTSFAFTLIAGLIAMTGISHADPFSGMRGTAISSTGRFGASVFYFGLNSTWESRNQDGKLIAAGTYSLKNPHQICFAEAASLAPSGPSGCMRYVGRSKKGLVLALYDSKGLVARFAVPAHGAR